MSCYKYWEKIKEIASSIKDYDELKLQEMPLDKIVPLLDSVGEIAHDQTIDFHSAKHILDDELMNNALKTIRRFYVDFGVKIETENAQKILESDDPWNTLESFHFYNRYEGLIRNESQLVSFTPGQKFVFIGSGPLPLTLILLNKTFGVHGIGIEMLPEVAELSQRVIDKLGLSSQIDVLVGEETCLNNIDYDIVMVAALAEPKERVFTNIWDTVDTSTPVIYRTYTGMRAILYSPVTERATRGFHKVVMILPTGKVNNTSVLIRKEI